MSNGEKELTRPCCCGKLGSCKVLPLPQCKQRIDHRCVNFNEGDPNQGFQNVHSLMIDDFENLFEFERCGLFRRGRCKWPRCVDRFGHRLPGGIKMRLKGIHQLVDVFLENKGNFNQRHVQLIDEVHGPLLKRYETVHGWLYHDVTSSFLRKGINVLPTVG